MLRQLILTLFTVGIFALNPARADDLPPTYDRISFQVSATQEVENDILVAIMYAERNGPQPAILANDVNETIAWAVALTKEIEAITVQTLNYRQEPLYGNQKVTGWRVRQSIRLESADSAALSTLIGELQARLSVASLQYAISPDMRTDVENTLIVEVLEKFEHRAQLISKQLGRADYRIVNVNIITSGPSPMPVRMRAAAAMADGSRVAPPTVEPGVQPVAVQVSGTIELEVR